LTFLGVSTVTDLVQLTLDDIYDLAYRCLNSNGADETNAGAVAMTVMRAERDGSASHGLFRIPGYVAALRSGKVNGAAKPTLTRTTAAVLKVDADNGFAPTALQLGCPALADAAKEIGIAALAVRNTYHFAALWPETEALAEAGLVGFACTAYKPAVAPAGASKALFGTNPIAFAWPRPGKSPMVFDMATASMALGEVSIAARDGHTLPPGSGLDATGNPTTDPNEVLKGVLLPFGGYKGSAIAMMVELLAGALIGERFSFEAAAADNNDGGPPRGGEFLFAINPAIISQRSDWDEHADTFFAQLEGMEGARLPGARRHQNRPVSERDGCAINAALADTIRSLIVG
jgi:delta1-piperideine-2-carboxylate reductase